MELSIRRRFKRQFDRNHAFLREIAQEGQGGEDYYKLKRIITYASDCQLNSLLDCVHFVLNGKVGLPTDHYRLLLKSPKLCKVQHKLESLSSFCALRKGHRKDKVDILIFLGKLLFPIIQSYFLDEEEQEEEEQEEEAIETNDRSSEE